MRDNTVRVELGNELFVKGPHVFQYDYGLVLIIEGIALPQDYEVHFSNKKHGIAKKAEITQEGVKIPDEYLRSGEDVFAWVYIRNGDEDGYTVYSIQFPVIGRSVEQGDNITPVQHNIIDEAIAALEDAVEKTEAMTNAEETDIGKALSPRTVENGKVVEWQYISSGGGGGGSGLPAGGSAGDLIIKRSSGDGDAEWVAPANSAEQDNTRPITAAAVYTEIGNINALLATI